MVQMVEILTGIAGSGKSTYAKQRAKDGFVIISRDDIRRDLLKEQDLSNYWKAGMDKFLEEYITKIEHQSLALALSRGESVIIDNTNLNPFYVEQYLTIIRDMGLALTQIEVKTFEIPIEEAFSRISKRDSTPMGREVLENQLNRFQRGWALIPLWQKICQTKTRKKWYFPKFPVEPYSANKELPPAILCDLDGTLSHRAVLKTPAPHMRSYYDVVEYNTDTADPFLTPILTAFLNTEKSPRIVFLTGRKSATYAETCEFLKRTFPQWEVHKDYDLFTRDEIIDHHEGKDDPDDLVKYRLFNEHIRDKYNVLGVFDDRRKVVALWQTLGLRTANMGLLNEEF